MEEQEQKIIEFMSDDDYVPMKAKEIAMLMRVPKNEYHKFLSTIGKLELELKIQKNRKNRYRVSEKTYYEGYFRKNARGYGFVRIEGQEDEIFIAKENSLNALNGDHVLIEITEEKNKIKSAEGKVVRILKREKDTLVGTFQNSKIFGFVVPDDKNFGTDIFISKKNFGKAKNNQKVLVKITKYPQNGKKAEGKIIEVLGNMNDAGVDMLSIIKEYKLPAKFSEQVKEEAIKCGNEIDRSEISKRVDLRDKTIFTIDGEDAKDLDDAVRVEKLQNGNYKLEVHIADVSYYVKENSLLDTRSIDKRNKYLHVRKCNSYVTKRIIKWNM